MDIAATHVRCSTTHETWTISHLTDLHDGAADHAEKELDARIAEIADDPRALWIGGGDYGDLILPGDPRSSSDGLSPAYAERAHRIPDFYLERLTERLWPIRDRCIAFGTGNHEATIGKHYHRGVGAELATRLGIVDKYLGWRGWAIINFKYNGREVPVRCYQYHGWSAGRLRGRKALQAERDIGAWAADAFFLGHDHQPYAETYYTEEVYGSKAGYRVRQRPRAIINGGSWTYGQRPPLANKVGRAISEFPNESWVEGKNFRPEPPRSPVLLVHLDFGHSAEPGKSGKGHPAGFAFETRTYSPTFHVG